MFTIQKLFQNCQNSQNLTCFFLVFRNIFKKRPKFKKKFDDGSFDTKDVNTHQLHSYHLTMKNKAETLTEGSSQPEVFNVLGQLQSIERIKKEQGQLQYETKDKLTHELGAKPE